METRRYNEEEAINEAVELQKYVESGAAKSYTEAQIISSFKSISDKKIQQYEKEAGHKANAGHFFEIMCREMLSEVSGIQSFLSSEDDDKKRHFDIIAWLDNGNKILVDVTATGSEEERQEKIHELSINPFLDTIHDDGGKVILHSLMPKALIYLGDKTEWGKALNEAEKHHSDYKSQFIPNRDAEKADLLSKIIQSLSASNKELVENKFNQSYKDIYNSSIAFLQKKIEELNKPLTQ